MTALLLLFGVTCLVAGIFDWDWFLNDRRVQPFVKQYGRDRARLMYAILGVINLSLAAAWFGGYLNLGPQNRPSDADYANILLLPALAEEIGLSLDQRLDMAGRGVGLVDGLAGRFPGAPTTPKAVEKLGSTRLAIGGRKVREGLPKDADKAFRKLFRRGDITSVEFGIEKPKSKLGTARTRLAYGWSGMTDDEVTSSLSACRKKLAQAYAWIPSQEAADELTDHDSIHVRRAAEKWLQQNDPDYDDREDEDGEGADDGDWETDTFADEDDDWPADTESGSDWVTETADDADDGAPTADSSRESFEERTRKMREDRDARVAKMRAESEERKREMREAVKARTEESEEARAARWEADKAKMRERRAERDRKRAQSPP